MAGYNLQPDESFVLRKDRITHGGRWAGLTDELILTSRNLVLVKKGTWGNTKGVLVFPLDQIKVFNGEAQAVLGKQRNGGPALDVYFANGHESFGFEKKRDVVTWAQKINQLLTDPTPALNQDLDNALPGTEAVADTLKDTVNVFKQKLGITSKKQALSAPVPVARPCSACGAPVSGVQGQVVDCSYCDTAQQL